MAFENILIILKLISNRKKCKTKLFSIDDCHENAYRIRRLTSAFKKNGQKMLILHEFILTRTNESLIVLTSIIVSHESVDKV